MGKQINQYTKTRTSGTVQNDDFLDFDSTEDSGTTFESAKITVLNFINYIKTQIPTIYSANSTLLTNRIITAAGLFTKWSGGDVIVEMDDLVTDHGFIVENSSSVEKARLGYDQSTSSAILDVKDNSGTTLFASDGKTGVGIDAPLSLLDVKTDQTGTNPVFLVRNGNSVALSLNTKLKVLEDGSFLSNSLTSVGTIPNGTYFEVKQKEIRLTSYQNNDNNLSGQGYTALYHKNYGNAGGRTGANGIGCNDSNAQWDSFSKLNLAIKTFNTSTSLTGLNVFEDTDYAINSALDHVFTLIKGSKTVGNLTNTGTGNAVFIGVDIDLQNKGDINYAALFNGGNVGIGTNNPLSKLTLKGSDSGATKNLLITDNLDVEMFSVENNGSLNMESGKNVLRPDGSTVYTGEGFSRLRLNPTGRVYLDKTMWVSSSQPISSSAQPSNVFIKFTNELTLSTLGKTSATTNDAMLFKSGVPVVDAVGLTETLFHFQNDGNDLLDIKANGVVKYKEFTVATLPLVTSGGFIMVTDESGGYTPAFCDGTNWRRTSDNAIVS